MAPLKLVFNEGSVLVIFTKNSEEKNYQIYQILKTLPSYQKARSEANAIYKEIKESLSPEMQQNLIDLMDARLKVEIESNEYSYRHGIKDGIRCIIRALDRSL